MDKEAIFKQLKRQLWLLGKFRIPLIGYTGVRLEQLDDDKAIVSVKLKRRTKNHLNSMYFGALAIGADVAGGIHAFYYAQKLNTKVSFAFKGMNAEFIMRAESDCTFVSKDGKKVEAAVQESLRTGDRVNETTSVEVFDTNKELVARFELIVSVKCKM